MTETSISLNSERIHRSRWYQWSIYIGIGIFLNAAAWGLMLLYLKDSAPTYTSKWGIIVLGADSEVDINLPDIGTATSSNNPRNSRPVPSQDPRTDYVYIANSAAVLAKAAVQVGLSVEAFGKPRIKISKGSAIIDFEINSDTPEKAQQKARVLHQVIIETVGQLRREELGRRKQVVETTLSTARERLETAQKLLADYQNRSILNSDEQIKNLSAIIEQLRRQQIDWTAQQKGLDSRLEQLSSDFNISDPAVDEAYVLQSDIVYKQYLEEYSQARSDLTKLLSQVGTLHPQVIKQKIALEGAASALQNRGSLLLSKPVKLEHLMHLNSLALDPKVKLVREEFFKEVAIDRADRQKLAAQNQQISEQIINLDNRLKTLAQEKLILDRLKRDVKIAEAIFTTTVAKLDLSGGNIYSIYPPIQLVSAPNLPNVKQPNIQSDRLFLLGGLTGSFLVTTPLILFWLSRQNSLKIS